MGTFILSLTLGGGLLALGLLVRFINQSLFNLPRLSHDEVWESRVQQGAVPEGFLSWGWEKQEIPTPWRGTVTLEWCPGSRRERTAIFVHGTSTNRFSMVRYMGVYRRLGFNLAFYDHPGHGNSPPTPPSYGWYEKGELAYLTEVLREKFPQTRDWVYHGESLGAGVLMEYLGRWPGLPGERRLGVSDCGYTNFEQVLRFRLSRIFPPGLRALALALTKVLFFLRTGSPLEGLKPGEVMLDSPVPLLLVHGTEDIRVPCTMSQQLWEQRRDRAPTGLYLVSGARHCKSWLADPHTYEQTVQNFIQTQWGKG